jgi:hypothetical protein
MVPLTCFNIPNTPSNPHHLDSFGRAFNLTNAAPLAMIKIRYWNVLPIPSVDAIWAVHPTKAAFDTFTLIDFRLEYSPLARRILLRAYEGNSAYWKILPTN